MTLTTKAGRQAGRQPPPPTSLLAVSTKGKNTHRSSGCPDDNFCSKKHPTFYLPQPHSP